ncbi:MAG: hypothetical protein RR090_10085 [Niameybacter sp.]|uniref:hypothetical protein n=1 Tax=Niameybacter sp. TaxID=2033640 RepID=UPI002FCB53C3
MGPSISSHKVRVYQNGIVKEVTCTTNTYMYTESYECTGCGELGGDAWTEERHSVSHS